MEWSVRAEAASPSLPTQPGARRAAELAFARGAETKKRILEIATELASREGLEALTIGKMAEALEMSKAGLFAHFGSKEELQLATVNAARQVFIEKAVAPGLRADAGLPRLVALCEHWLDYSGSFEGGCFFAAASSEFDGRPGPVRDRIAECMKEWISALERAVKEAQKLGHLSKDVNAPQIAFELSALSLGSNWARQLFNDKSAVPRCRTAMRERLNSIATGAGRKLLKPAIRPK
jgi:AcrR family transcriptional regulator